MRGGYRFTPYAPNRALVVGKGIAEGLTGGIQAYAKIKMQQAQMKAHQANAEAMSMYRKAQGELMRQKSLGSNMADLRLMKALSDGEHLPEATLRPLIKDKVSSFLQTARPEEKNAMAAHIEQQIKAGEIPSEIMPQIGVGLNELRSFDRMGTTQGKKDVAEITGKHKDYSADKYGETRVKVGQLGYQGKVDAATINANRPGAGHSSVNQMLKDSNARMMSIQKSIDSLDKPTPAGAISPMDPKVRDSLHSRYEKQLFDEHENYNSLAEKANGAAANPPPPGTTPMAPAQPRYLKDTNGAKPGDFVQGPNGYFKVGPSGKGYESGADGSAAVFPGQRAPQSEIAPPPTMAAPDSGLDIEAVEE